MDPLTTLTAVGLVVVPGIALGYAMFSPGELSIPVAVGLVIPLGFLVVSLLAFALAIGRVLYLPVFAIAITGVTAAAFLFGARRHPFRDHLSVWKQEIAEHRWTYALGALLVVAVVVIRLGYSPVLNLYSSTPFRYWADGVEIADAHRVPKLSLQWGQLFPPTVSKIALNSFHSAGTLVLGRGPLVPMGALLFLVSVGLFLAAMSLAYGVGFRLTAPLFAMFLFLNRIVGIREMTRDLDNYKAENWGRVLMMAAVLLLVRAIRSEDSREARREGLLGAALLGVTAATHMVPFVIGAALVGGFALAEWVFRRRFVPLLRRVALFGAVALILPLLIVVSSGGDWGFQGVSATGSYANVGRELGLGASWDPTLFLAEGVLNQVPTKPYHGFYVPPRFFYSRFSTALTGGLPFHEFVRRILPLLLAAGLVVVFIWGSEELRAASIAAAVLGLALIGATLYFDYRFNTYALAQFGIRRLNDYFMVPVLLVSLGVLEILLMRGAALVARFRWTARSIAPAGAALTIVALFAIMVPKAVAPAGSTELAKTALAPLSEIQLIAPCSGRILGSQRTLATFQLFTRRAGVIEGMGPFFRPEILVRSIRDMFRAMDFFADPSAHEEYVRQEGIAVVVVLKPPFGGSPNQMGAHEATLSVAPFLEEVASSPLAVVYRVRDFDPSSAARFPDVVRQPGYLCRTG